MNTIDDIRANYPHLGITLYAIEPGQPVTLELISAEGAIFTFGGATEAEAVAAAFPEDVEPPTPTTPAFSVFD